MHLVLLCHPRYSRSKSMPRYAAHIAEGMRARGHTVSMLEPERKISNLRGPAGLQKWLSYVDQFGLFSAHLRYRLSEIPQDALFVVTDQALGMWVPLIKGRLHVVHCHDFLALRSALGEFPENRLTWTGRAYQRLILRGLRSARNFISISHATRRDLHRLLPSTPARSSVVYNGVNPIFLRPTPGSPRQALGEHLGILLNDGYFLHVGGNQWYKNRLGVIALYCAYREITGDRVPLLLIGNTPTAKLLEFASSQRYAEDIHFLSDVSDQLLPLAYAGAKAFLFPSLEEGFGWPIVEAMASGTPVLVTERDPMTEVGGDAVWYLRRMPETPCSVWAHEGARKLRECIQACADGGNWRLARGYERSASFSLTSALDGYEACYVSIYEGLRSR